MKVARSIKRLPEWLRSFVGANALRVMALGALVAVAVPAVVARAEPPPLQAGLEPPDAAQMRRSASRPVEPALGTPHDHPASPLAVLTCAMARFKQGHIEALGLGGRSTEAAWQLLSVECVEPVKIGLMRASSRTNQVSDGRDRQIAP